MLIGKFAVFIDPPGVSVCGIHRVGFDIQAQTSTFEHW